MSNYRLEVFVGDKIYGQGSGWLVQPDVIVTAFHVVGEPTTKAFFHSGLADVRYILWADASPHELAPLIFDPDADIALLSPVQSAPDLKTLRLASRDRQAPGIAWSGQGFPGFHHRQPFTLSGTVVARRGWDGAKAMQLLVEQGTGASWNGVSGTPVIDNDSGAVIGMITEMTDDASTGWAATTVAIERLLGRYGKPCDDLGTVDQRLLYQRWLDLTQALQSDPRGKRADLLRQLYQEWHGRDEALDTIAGWLLEAAWTDLLVDIVVALEDSSHVQLLQEARGRLFGSRRLTIHLVYHHACERAKALTRAIFSALARPVDDAAHFGLNIPIFFWESPDLELLDLDQAQRSLVLVLIDDEMVLSSDWHTSLSQLNQKIPQDDPRHGLVPCALTRGAKDLDEQLEYRTFLDLSGHDEKRQEDLLLIRLIHRLLGLLGRPTPGDEIKAKVFVSYARSDGGQLKEALQVCVAKYSLQVVELVTDASHAEAGRQFETLLGRIGEAVVVVLQTDAYASRVWCKREILWAKNARAPILVVDALNKGETRSFPYFGNVRTMRLDTQGSHEDAPWPLQVIRDALSELLFHRVFNDRAKIIAAVGLVDRDSLHDARPPELLTIKDFVRASSAWLFLHPDPPLIDAEAGILKAVAPNCTAATPTTIVAESFPNQGLRVGLSISDSATLAKQGLDRLQLYDLWVALSRHLLLSGARLVYGLDLRTGGYGEIMLSLLEQRHGVSKYKCAPALSLIAWPLYLNPDGIDDSARWAELSKVVRHENVPLPPLAEAVAQRSYLEPDSMKNQYIWCRSLTHMRKRMVAEVDALVAIGGKVSGYKGRYPGVIEEVKMALEHNLPVFLVGGFGGCGAAMARAVKNVSSSELTLEYQAREAGRHALIEYFNCEIERDLHPVRPADRIDYGELQSLFQTKGVRGLNNGLSLYENERLFVTTSVNEIIWLVLKGLTAIRKDERDRPRRNAAHGGTN